MKLFKRLTALFVVMFAFVAVLAIANVEAAETVNVTSQFGVDTSNSAKLAAEDWDASGANGAYFTASTNQTLNGTKYNSVKALRVNNNQYVTYTVPSGRITKSISFSIYAFVNNSSVTGTYTVTAKDASGNAIANTSVVVPANAVNNLNYAQIVTTANGLGALTGTVTSSTDSIASLEFKMSCTKGTILTQIDLSYEYETVLLTQLDSPTNVVASHKVEGDKYITTVTFDSVENATVYNLYLYTVGGENPVSSFENFTSGDEVEYYVPGIYEFKVVALGDGENYATSEESAASNSIEIKAIETTIENLCGLLDSAETADYQSKYYYSVTGYLTISGTKYYINDNGYTMQMYNVKKNASSTSNYNFSYNVDGDIVSLEAPMKLYYTTKEFEGGYVTSVNTAVALGYQVSELDAEANTVSLRLLAGLNVDYADVTALSLVIEGANENNVLKFYTVYDKIVADTKNGITEITAEELGFATLAALTITDVPTEVSLTVTISYTTSEGPFQSATKTYTVAADGTVTVA